MRSALFLAAVALIPAITADANLVAQVPVLHYVVTVNESYEAGYVPRAVPPANHVFFQTESINLRLEVGNRGDVSHSLKVDGLSADGAFRVTAVGIPAGASVPGLTLSAEIEVIDGGLISRKSLGDSLEVPARGSVVWTARFTPQTPWATGMYDLRVSPAFGADSDINPLGTIVRFEVRPVQGVAEQAEVIRRRLMRAYRAGLRDQTAQEADRLLRVFPQSSIAYEMKAELAKQDGRQSEASTLLRQALALITSGQDNLFLRDRGESEVRQRIDDLTRRVNSLR